MSDEALLKLPSFTVMAYLECAGIQLALFEEGMNRPIQITDDGFGGTKWLTGGVGNAVWTGVSLKTLLEMAGLDPSTVEVNAKGLAVDTPKGGTNRPIPIEKALI